jgi:DNA-binding CsgD family transcriptional regulator
MRNNAVDIGRLQQAAARLGDAAIDPSIWPVIIQEISAAAGARGAAMLQSDVRTPDVPCTPDVGDYFRRSYFAEGWHARDIRAERGVPLLLKGAKVISDQDIVTPDEMQRVGLYAESLVPNGLKWFAAIGFWSGPALWGLTIQRTDEQGAFDEHDKRALGSIAQRLTETATLSWTVGRVALSGMTNGLELVRQPALALDRVGRVIDMNRLVEPLLSGDIRISDQRLLVRDKYAAAALESLIDQLRKMPDTGATPSRPIIVQREGKRPVVIGVLPIHGAARTPFLGARAMLTLTDLEAEVSADSTVIAQAFGLSSAETRLALLVGNGTPPALAADELGIAHETARSQLKSVFAKTGTHRQAELVALLARLPKLTRGESSS